jgi:hypothetical protein
MPWLVITVKSSKLATMKHLLPLLLLLISSAVLAESGIYRVEVIVFRNLLPAAVPAEVSELRSFSRYPLLEDTRPVDNSTAETAVEPAGVLRSDLPDDLRVVTEKGNAMDNAWRRLRSSNSYRPLVYTAWEQNRIDYYPPLRIHDMQVLATRLQPPTPIMLADLTAPDPLAAYRTTFYQLDGSAQLRRSRFLHLFLDLEIREEMPPGPAVAGIPGENYIQKPTGSFTDRPVTYGVYKLKQNRQVSTGEMQYFDTPYFGALVYVTSIEANQAPQ